MFRSAITIFSRAGAALAVALSLSAMFAPSASAQAPAGVNSPAIEWSVVHRFRLFDTPALRGVEEALMIALESPESSISDTTVLGLVLDGVTAHGQANAPYLNTPYHRETQSYDEHYLRPASYDISAKLDGASDGAQCAWSLNHLPARNGPCRGYVVTIRRDQALYRPGPEAGAHLSAVQLDNAANAAETDVAIDDVLVASMGDSYASGEGNPDQLPNYVAIEAALCGNQAPPCARERQWWPRVDGLGDLTAASAQWWDTPCHRSLLSSHAFAAMRFAALHPHGAVTYVSFACSGAGALDGFLSPQAHTPGETRTPTWHKGIATNQAQVEQLMALLCRGDHGTSLSPTAIAPDVVSHYPVDTPESHHRGMPEVHAPYCLGALDRPDFVLLSLGGNDAEFGGLSAWALLLNNGAAPPHSNATTFWVEAGVTLLSRVDRLSIVCPIDLGDHTFCSRWDPSEQLALHSVPGLLALARSELAKMWTRQHIPAPTILQTQYANPVLTESGAICGNDPATPAEALTLPWSGLSVALRAKAHVSLVLGLSRQEGRGDCIQYPSEGCLIASRVIPALNEAVGGAGGQWALPSEALRGHSLCSGAISDAMALPNLHDLALSTRESLVNPYYLHRTRWFRATNDSIAAELVVGMDFDGDKESISGTLHGNVLLYSQVGEQLARAMDGRP